MADARTQIQRLLLVISYARRHRGARVEEVARAVGMTPAELKASVPALSLVGKPPFAPDDLIDIAIEGDRLYVELDQALGRPLRLSGPEWLALAIALRSLAASGAGDLAETARGVLGRIEALGPEGDAAALEKRFSIEAEDHGRTAEKFRVLEHGLRERRAVDLVYYTASRDELSPRRLRPYALVQSLGAWYVVGHDSRRDEVRLFKVERIREASLTDERFDPPPGFDAPRYARGRLSGVSGGGTARIRFVSSAARSVLEDHPPERVTRGADGSVELQLDYQTPEWVAGWALSFGEAAEVLGPAEVQEAVATRCREALAHYSDGAA
jgi:proteasome accessory factor C